MNNYLSLVLSVLLFVCNSVSGFGGYFNTASSVYGDCTKDDLIEMMTQIAKYFDLVTIAINGYNGYPDSTIDFTDEFLTENFAFDLTQESGFQLIDWHGRDEVLTMHSMFWTPAKIWFYSNPGWLESCVVNGNIAQAVYRSRGGDHIRSPSYNFMSLVPYKFHFVRDRSGQTTDGYRNWKALNYSTMGGALSDFGVFPSTLGQTCDDWPGTLFCLSSTQV